MTIRNYIKNKKIKHFTTFGVEVFIKDEVTNGVSAKAVINKALKKIPNQTLNWCSQDQKILMVTNRFIKRLKDIF